MYSEDPPPTSVSDTDEGGDHSAHGHPKLCEAELAANPPFWSWKTILWVSFFLVLTAAADCANFRSVFIPGDHDLTEIYYADGDCYSRMERVREILVRGGIIHFQAWENYPQGIASHATAPMDYLIAALALLLKPFFKNYVDLAGAIISPLLGVATTAFLAFWARELNQRYRRLMLLLASLSPMLAHGMALGRPDHQSLQILLMAIGIGSELAMVRQPCRFWSIASGIAWGLGLWVSLYEPLILLAIVLLAEALFYRDTLFIKKRLWSLGFMVAIVAIGYGLEGFNITRPDEVFVHYFKNWASTIGELATVPIFSQILQEWVGWGLLAAPVLLIARLRDARRSRLLLLLLVVTFGFTLAQVRWGYFFVLVYTMSVPWQLSVFRKHWAVWTLFVVSLWPMIHVWEQAVFPDEASDLYRTAQLTDQRRLRQAAIYIGEHEPGGILAPWWLSPQLAYWSNCPAVAGSSHESLAGIVDTARFFAATDVPTARDVCWSRKVETVVMTEPSFIVDQSLRILSQPAQGETMADILWERPHSAPPFLQLIFDNSIVKAFRVVHPPYTDK